jgi:hypothetical protein
MPFYSILNDFKSAKKPDYAHPDFGSHPNNLQSLVMSIGSAPGKFPFLPFPVLNIKLRDLINKGCEIYWQFERSKESEI